MHLTGAAVTTPAAAEATAAATTAEAAAAATGRLAGRATGWTPGRRIGQTAGGIELLLTGGPNEVDAALAATESLIYRHAPRSSIRALGRRQGLIEMGEHYTEPGRVASGP
jgi:hypothetical protein